VYKRQLFTACGEETKKVVEEVNKTKVAEAVKKDTISALETAKIKMAEAADAAKAAATEMAAEAKVEAEKMAAEASDKAAQLKQAAAEAMAPKAPAVYDKCKGCHGLEGKTAALGKSAIIGGQDKQAIIASMNAYKEGTKNEVGMGSLMKGQAASLSDEEIEAIAEYLSKQ
jgi:cytochrome c553